MSSSEGKGKERLPMLIEEGDVYHLMSLMFEHNLMTSMGAMCVEVQDAGKPPSSFPAEEKDVGEEKI